MRAGAENRGVLNRHEVEMPRLIQQRIALPVKRALSLGYRDNIGALHRLEVEAETVGRTYAK